MLHRSLKCSQNYIIVKTALGPLKVEGFFLHHSRTSFHSKLVRVGEEEEKEESITILGDKRTSMHMENDENFDLDKLEAQLINNDDTFSRTTSSYNGESFSKADKELILLIDEFDSADDKDDESDDLGELVDSFFRAANFFHHTIP